MIRPLRIEHPAFQSNLWRELGEDGEVLGPSTLKSGKLEYLEGRSIVVWHVSIGLFPR